MDRLDLINTFVVEECGWAWRIPCNILTLCLLTPTSLLFVVVQMVAIGILVSDCVKTFNWFNRNKVRIS